MHASSPAPFESSCEWQPRTIADLLNERATLRPNDVAYRFLGDSEANEVVITYARLAQRARAIGAGLAATGCAGRPVLLLFPAGIDFPVAFFGTLYAGAIAVPAAPPRMSETESRSRLEGIVADSNAALILTTRELAPRVTKAGERSPTIRWPRIATIDSVAANDLDHRTPPLRRPGTPAVLQYTSGSTSSPKGVAVSDTNILHNLSIIARATSTSSASIGVSWLPHYHDMGLIGGLLLPIHSGFPVTLMSPASFLQRPMRWLQAISDCCATISAAPNFAYQLCARKAGAEPASLDLSAWQVALCGSEPIRADTMRLFATTFGPYGFRESALFPSYGLAEATLMVSGGPQGQRPAYLDGRACGGGDASDDEADDQPQRVASGRVPEAVCVDIVDPARRTRCAPGRIGEIWVAGGSVAAGYWNKPEESAAVFGAVIAGTNEGPYLRTGDLGFLHDGLLYVAGRISDVIIIRGVNYHPQDVERTVEDAIAAGRTNICAAFSVPADGEERLVVVLEADKHRTADYGGLFNAIRRSVVERHALETHAISVIRRGTIPLTSSGKLQRRRCRAAFLNGALIEVARWSARPDSNLDVTGDLPGRLAELPPEARQSWLEGAVAGEVARVMNLEPSDVDPLAPIVSFGLDSLRAARLRNQLERLLDVAFDLTDLIDHSTIADLCARAVAQIEARTTELTNRINELSDDEVIAALKQERLLLNEEHPDERLASSSARKLA